MNYLAIDYGRKKIGLAIGDVRSRLAEPLVVVRGDNQKGLIEKVEKVIQIEKIEKVILGISEGEMAVETKEFGKKLFEKTGIEIICQDETLTSKEAQNYSIQAHINRKKRHKMEDAYAAALILQNFLDSL